MHEDASRDRGRRKKLTIGAGLLTGAYEQDCDVCPNRPTWQRERWGCEADAPRPFAVIPWRGGSIPVKRCPSKTLPPEILSALRWIGHARNGNWPCAGGLLDQSATFVRAFEVVSAEISRQEAANRG